ncbi:hypothetical protein EJ05DRAFT_509986 [Pseudovirgaria hyperparasitica]|uniref:Cora-domain-containing protein n=1 Tax=Pseudovirgaria hyperparasitica TaxID=470096 RepID=A0A6A6WAR2_9PEZI|nr:uncharacterized protein EJ05DRAFT_509986 [Pseudovirgaria hyperparasitica]KAF2759124.1 hypothetical protein EJ05DRAFT_509986 [Pseudovirgaria hyperparasitica]
MDGESDKRQTPLSPTPDYPMSIRVQENRALGAGQGIRHSPDSDDLQQRPTYAHNSHVFHHTHTHGLTRLAQKHRKATLGPLQQWEEWEQDGRGPYHEYVHKCLEAGWTNLQDLDDYLSVDFEDLNLKISVMDIKNDNTAQHYEEMHDDIELAEFMREVKPFGCKSRIYVVEQSGYISSSIMESFGSALQLDPRFFQWHIRGSKHMLSIATRNRTPFITLNFRISDPSGETPTDTKTFKASIYVSRASPDFWTGVVFISSHSKVMLSSHSFLTPPTFTPDFSNIPTPQKPGPKTFRELYIEMLASSNLAEAALSPFVAFSPLFKLNCYTFNQLMYTFRQEDAKVEGVSELYPVNLTEEIRRSLESVERGGSLGWKASSTPFEQDTKERLREDFNYALKSSEMLWQAREKYNDTHHRRTNARISALANAFAFFFAPISLISSIYGMNITEISGDDSNPRLWQFFVAVAGLCVVIMLIIAVSAWVQMAVQLHRRARFKDILTFALGTSMAATVRPRKASTVVLES